MKNPVILGVAATNRPHVRLREHPISIVEVDGKKMVRVPFMVKGRYRHPLGTLDFTDDVFDKMIVNHTNKVGDFGEGLDVKHIPDLGSLAWFDPEDGGKIVKEGNLLVGYGVPTGADALKFVEDKKFKWASVEFHPDYKSTLEKKYLEAEMIASVDLVEENITLANPYRDAFGRWASKGGGAVKKVVGKMKTNYKKGQQEAADVAAQHGDSKKEFKATVGRAKRFGSGVKSGFKDVYSWRGGKKFNEKWKNEKSRAKKAGMMTGWIGGHAAGAAAGMYVASKLAPKLDYQPFTLSNDLQPTLVKEALSHYVSNGGHDEFVWFDKEVFNWDEMNLPVEDGHYKVDKQTAEEMLAALDELAQAQPDVFYTEDEMETLDEALARIEELEEELAQYVTPEPTEREKQLEAMLEAQGKQLTENTVRLEIEAARNYKDSEGKGHSAYVLNFMGDVMLGKPLADESIKLENLTDAGAVANYFRKAIAEFLRTAPGTMPVENKTVVPEDRKLEAEKTDYTSLAKSDAKDFWGNPVVG